MMLDKNIRILILEDRASDAELVQFCLIEAGFYTSQWALNKQEFLLALQDFSPDLILSDYDLSQYNGALALDDAKRLLPHVPFILVTGALNDESQISKILAEGASTCILKDHLGRLPAAIHKALHPY